MNFILETIFTDPEKVILNFIKSSYDYSKSCPIGPKGDSKECLASALEIMHYYTYIKYHPYANHRSGLDDIKNIKEIDFLEKKSKTEVQIHTKKNQTVIPACVFTLKLKKQKWRVSEVLIKKGNNERFYHSIFLKQN